MKRTHMCAVFMAAMLAGCSTASTVNDHYESDSKFAHSSSAEIQTSAAAVTPAPTAVSTPEAAAEKAASSADVQYQAVLDEYSGKISSAVPQLVAEYNNEAAANANGIEGLAEISTAKIQKLAEIEAEGTEKMAEVYYSAGGDYAVYEDWAGKLYDVYEAEAGKITDAYMNSAM